MSETMWKVLMGLGWLVHLAVMVGAARVVLRSLAAMRRDLDQGLGVAAQAFGTAAATFDKQAVTLLREVRAVGQSPSPAVPAAPPSGVQASAPAVDSGESEDEHRTVEMAVWKPEGRESDVDEKTVVRDAATVTPLGARTREKLARLREVPPVSTVTRTPLLVRRAEQAGEKGDAS